MLVNKITPVLLVITLLMLVFYLPGTAAETKKVKVTLDWTPNTNHTGIYVASELGFFTEEGLKVDVVQPSETTSIQLTSSGKTEFGVSHQESVTMARDKDVPVISIAAIIQKNTSGFAAPADAGIEMVEDFEDKRFGGWGTELYNKIVQSVMNERGSDFSSVDFVNLGMTDFVTAARKGLADFFWIFYGWQGIHAEMEGLDITYIPARELSDTFNYYTPVFITSEKMVRKNPETVRSFLKAVSKGYGYAEENPKDSARILLDSASELDKDLVMKSQEFLSDKYSEGAEQWGIQERSVWEDFTAWLHENELIEEKVDVEEAFTNEFLPENGE
ncbi:MAG: ABC transporter substrate-binding protein [Candidatus Acetothermia bacterium]